MNERQKERLRVLADIAGSIKAPFDVNTVDAVDEVNVLRGKPTLSDKQEELMEIIKRTAGSVKLNHPINSVEVIKEIRGGMYE